VRSTLSIILLSASGFVVACGGSNEPAKAPSDVTSSQLPAANPTTPAPTTTSASPSAMNTTPPSTDSSSSTSAPAAATLSDAEIVAITSAANNGEIELAKFVLKGTQNAQVKSFAQMMVKEHGEAEAKGKKLAQAASITPKENDISSKLKADTESTLGTLKSQKGAELDRAYIESQVKAHKEVLSTIDDKLLPSVKNADLKTHLNEVRGHVASHLAKAEEISSNLSAKASTTPTKH
jgi:putative membrane protein